MLRAELSGISTAPDYIEKKSRNSQTAKLTRSQRKRKSWKQKIRKRRGR